MELHKRVINSNFRIIHTRSWPTLLLMRNNRHGKIDLIDQPTSLRSYPFNFPVDLEVIGPGDPGHLPAPPEVAKAATAEIMARLNRKAGNGSE
jgi:hypothetical protein